MASLSTCHLGLWLGWQILLKILLNVLELWYLIDVDVSSYLTLDTMIYNSLLILFVLVQANANPGSLLIVVFNTVFITVFNTVLCTVFFLFFVLR